MNTLPVRPTASTAQGSLVGFSPIACSSPCTGKGAQASQSWYPASRTFSHAW